MAGCRPKEAKFLKQSCANNEQREWIRVSTVRPEARAGEFLVVARLILLKEQPNGNRIAATGLTASKGEGMKMPESLLEDLKPCDLFLSRLKSAFKRMEDRLRC
jgi:hypothetical protein